MSLTYSIEAYRVHPSLTLRWLKSEAQANAWHCSEASRGIGCSAALLHASDPMAACRKSSTFALLPLAAMLARMHSPVIAAGSDSGGEDNAYGIIGAQLHPIFRLNPVLAVKSNPMNSF